jgi:hypothetical protein
MAEMRQLSPSLTEQAVSVTLPAMCHRCYQRSSLCRPAKFPFGSRHPSPFVLDGGHIRSLTLSSLLCLATYDWRLTR